MEGERFAVAVDERKQSSSRCVRIEEHHAKKDKPEIAAPRMKKKKKRKRRKEKKKIKRETKEMPRSNELEIK